MKTGHKFLLGALVLTGITAIAVSISDEPVPRITTVDWANQTVFYTYKGKKFERVIPSSNLKSFQNFEIEGFVVEGTFKKAIPPNNFDDLVTVILKDKKGTVLETFNKTKK